MQLLNFFDKHRGFLRAIDAYADGELDRGRAAQVERHLQACSQCARSLEERQLIKRLAASLPEVVAPRTFRITEAMLAAAAARPTTPARSGPPPWALNLTRGAVAAALLGLVVTVTLDLRRDGGSDRTAAAPISAAAESHGTAAPKSFDSRSATGAGGAAPAAAAPQPPQSPATPANDNAAPIASQAAGPSQSPAKGVAGGQTVAPAISQPQRADDSDDGLDWLRASEAGFALVAVGLTGGVYYLMKRK